MIKFPSYMAKMVLGSILVWAVTIMLFTEEIVFNKEEATGGSSVDVSEVADGTYIGTGEGYGGPIEVEVTVASGEITEINVLEHGETAGISDPAFEGIPTAIITENSTDVEVVSGATFTSNGLKEAVANALAGEPGEGGAAEEEPTEDEETPDKVEVSDAEYPDGTYEATVDGHNGPLTVVVTVEGNVIANVEVTEHEETAGLADPALEDVPAAIVARNATDVDVVSGATVTSEAIIEAVNQALEGPGPQVKAASVTDGVYEATVDGRNAPLTVAVTVEGGAITNVEVTNHEETEEISDPAIADVPVAIVENNSTDVEVVSGATITSEAIIAAVDQALLAGATAYEVTVDAHNGPLTVIVELTDGAVSSVEVTEHEETAGLADPAFADIPAAIVENNSTDVEVVSGATVTSEAIIEAVNLVLEAVNE